MPVSAARTAVLALALAAIPALTACDDETILAPEEVAFAPDLNVDLSSMQKLPSGVYVETIQVGLGSRSVEESDDITVDYTLWLSNGTEISSAEFTESMDNLIPGFQDGVLGMVEGEIRRIVVPWQQGYGSRGRDDIPGYATLVFRVELIDIPTAT